MHFRALQIVRDMKAVNEIKDQFTLADVLPSSLEISDRSACSHHSGNNLSRHAQSQSIQNISKQLPPIHEKTINAEEDNSVGLIDEPESRATLEIAKSVSGEEVKERMTSGEGEHSQRALNFVHEQEQVIVDESSKHNLIASMLAKSGIDLDASANLSRNDVVPQKTQLDSIDHEPHLRVHPERSKLGNGIQSDPGSSIDHASSDSAQSDMKYHKRVHRGPKRIQDCSSDSFSEREDNEAEQVH